MSRPAIVLKSQFIMPNDKRFQNYIKYIDRKDAKEKQENSLQTDEFQTYMKYMGDEKKRGELFIKDTNIVSKEERKHLEIAFQVAQRKGSPLWQDVISFDNDWLEKQAIYDRKTKQLNEDKMKNIVREAMLVMLTSEQMESSSIWAAAIHYNTDNIHVHIATVEPNPSRAIQTVTNPETGIVEKQFRAKRKQKSLDRMKSRVANLISDRTMERKRTDELIKGTAKKAKEVDLQFTFFREMSKLHSKILINLPRSRREWHYGYQTMNQARPYIDQMTSSYLERYHEKDMVELKELLKEESQHMKVLYGEHSNYNDYVENSMADLYKRMGNAILSEIRKGEKEKKEIPSVKTSSQMNHFRKQLSFGKVLNQLNYAMQKSYYDYKKERNLDEYDRELDQSKYR